MGKEWQRNVHLDVPIKSKINFTVAVLDQGEGRRHRIYIAIACRPWYLGEVKVGHGLHGNVTIRMAHGQG